MQTIVPGSVYLFDSRIPQGPISANGQILVSEVSAVTIATPTRSGVDPIELVMALIDHETTRQQEEPDVFGAGILRSLNDTLSEMMRRREWENLPLVTDEVAAERLAADLAA